MWAKCLGKFWCSWPGLCVVLRNILKEMHVFQQLLVLKHIHVYFCHSKVLLICYIVL